MAEQQQKNEAASPEDTQKLLAMSEISLLLDNYDDIFSDFDPRPYAQRALSIDFLEEAKRASRDKDFGNIELQLMIPNSLRSIGKEALIKKRLREHFGKHFISLKKEMGRTVRHGAMFTILGLILMLAASIVVFRHSNTLMASILIVLLEPAGWFFFWEGMNVVIFDSKKQRPEVEFYGKMADCKITFMSYS